MLLHLFNTALHAAEQGRLPDFAVRAGIRQLLKQRLRSLECSVAEQAKRTQQFADHCRRSAVAVGPELANRQHYEVPAEFFQHVLGQRLKYSCSEWSAGVCDLDEAEQTGLATTCERAGLADGMQILELGCGWGSLSLWMAEHFPGANITAVSNSRSQREYIQRQVSRRGLRNLNVITADMNDFNPATAHGFDRVVSVEMFEHMRNHEQLMQRIATWLRPGGQLFVHIFTHQRHSYLFETQDDRDWMSQHFFSGGMMPSESLLPSYRSNLLIHNQWHWPGRYYERTCNAWLHRQDKNRDVIMPLFEQTYGAADADIWFHRWRIFFMSCAELFGYRNGTEWRVTHYLFEKP